MRIRKTQGPAASTGPPLIGGGERTAIGAPAATAVVASTGPPLIGGGESPKYRGGNAGRLLQRVRR